MRSPLRFLLKSSIFPIFALCSTAIYGQKNDNNNFYSLNPYSYNMAYASAEKDLQIALHLAGPSAGLTNSPSTASLFLRKGLLRQAGVGMRIMYDQRGIFRTTRLMLESGYTVVIDPATKHFFRMGLSTGVNIETLDLPLLEENGYSDMSDPMLSMAYKDRLDVQFGTAFVYQFGGFDMGVSAPFILGLYGDRAYMSDFWKHFAFSIKYEMNIEEDIRIQPMFVGQFISSDLRIFDTSLLVSWNKQIFVQMGYRSSQAILSTFGVWVGPVLLGYAMELPVGNQRNLAGPAHSMMINLAVNEKLLSIKRKRKAKGFIPGQGKAPEKQDNKKKDTK